MLDYTDFVKARFSEFNCTALTSVKSHLGESRHALARSRARIAENSKWKPDERSTFEYACAKNLVDFQAPFSQNATKRVLTYKCRKPKEAHKNCCFSTV